MCPAQFNQAVTPISPVYNYLNSFFRQHYAQLFIPVTIVFQSFPTQKKISNPSRLLVWTSLLTLSSLFYLLSLLPRKYLLTRPRLTRRLLHLYKLLTILQPQSQMSLRVPQPAYRPQIRSLKSITLKQQKNFIDLAHSYRTFDPFFPALITSNFNPINLL